MNKDLLSEIIDSLTSMVDYADDGSLNRNDPDYSCFFKDIDKAKDLIIKLNNILVNMEVKYENKNI